MQSLPQKLAEAIIRFIVQENLKPGDKLPNEVLMAQSLKVGRSSVREAMKILASRNIIEVRQGSGTYVSNRPGVCDDPLGLIFLRDNPKLICDMMEIRLLVEPSVTAMAARNADEKEIRKIFKICTETEEMARAGQNYAAKDIEFHQAIAVASKNLLAPRIFPIVCQTQKSFAALNNQECHRFVVMSHRKIADAILHRDTEAAKDNMYIHLIMVRSIVTEENSRDRLSET